MGDWAYGELTNKGKKDGTDFSHVTFPGTAEIFDFVGDAFVIPAENAPNPEAEKVWLTQLLDPKVQSEFNLEKGSAPVIKDASLDGYPDYQKKAAEAFQTKTIVSSLAHAQSAPGGVRHHLQRRRHLLPGLEERRCVPQDHDRGAEEPARLIPSPLIGQPACQGPHTARALAAPATLPTNLWSQHHERHQRTTAPAGYNLKAPTPAIQSRKPATLPRRRTLHGAQPYPHFRLRLRVHRLLRLDLALQLEAADPTRPDLARPPRRHLLGNVPRAAVAGVDMRNIIVFTVLFLILAVVTGLVLAILVHRVTVAKGLFRSVFLLPYALSFIVTGVAFRWIFNPNSGINKWLVDIFGIENPPQWSTSTTIALSIYQPSGEGFLKVDLGIPVALLPIVIAAAWQLSGFAMAMYLAGLAGIPEEELEAASMDGAGEFKQLRHIMLPQLWPVTVTCLILLLHTALKIFDLVVAMAGSGPGFVTDVPGIYVYDMMGKAGRYDKGTAAALVLLITAGLFVVPYLIRIYRKERGN